ncbi:MAG: Ig-like domain-containing protein, partial [Candidatus Micrarchaeia archaeon]
MNKKGLIILLILLNLILLLLGCSSSDKVPPEVEIAEIIPESYNNGAISGIVKIRVRAFDPTLSAKNKVAKLELYIDNNLVSNKLQEIEDFLYEYLWNTNNLAYNSNHTIKAKAYDNAGNIGESKEVVVKIGENKPPQVTITNPKNGETVSGNVTIEAQVTDLISIFDKKIITKAPSGISKVEFYIDGVLVGEDKTSPYTYTWNTDNLQYNSTHTIKAIAYDIAGNKGESSVITVKIGDTKAPQVTIVRPSNNQLVSGEVTIEAQVTDLISIFDKKIINKAPSGIQRVEFYIDNVKVGEDSSSPYTYTWYTNQSGDGIHTITVKGIDLVGNEKTASIQVKVDNTPPSVSITSPTNNQIVSGNVTIEVSASDTNGIQRVEFYIDNVKVGEDNSSPYTYTWNTNQSGDGIHTITVKGIDLVGNEKTASIQVKVDNTPPSVSITSPTDGETVSRDVTIEVSASDTNGIQRVEFYIDNVKVGEDSSSPYTYTWNTDNLQYNSTHTIKAIAYDIAGNKKESNVITVKIGDTKAPQITILKPSNNQLVSGEVTIEAQVVDLISIFDKKIITKAPSGVSRVEFYIDDVKIGEDNSPPYTYTWDTKGVGEGIHTITVKGKDLAENEGIASIQVNVDNTPPSVSITSPTDGEIVSGDVTIEVSADDTNGIQKVEFYIDNVKVGDDSSSPYTYTWNTDNLQYNSTHTIKAIAYDIAGNKKESSVITVKIGDTRAPQVTIVRPTNNQVVEGIVIIEAQVVDKISIFDKKIITKAPSGIQRVEFYIDGVKVGEDNSPPYTYTWDTTNLQYNTTHTIQAKAYDI